MQKIALRMPKGPDFKAPTPVAIRSGNPLFVWGMAAHVRGEKPWGSGMLRRRPGRPCQPQGPGEAGGRDHG